MANKEQVIIEMLAEIDGYVKDMKKAREESDKTRGGIELDFKKIAKSSVKLGANVATAIGTAIAALSTMAVMSGKNVRELENLSRQAKLSTEDFKSLTFAVKQYGVTGEQIADISKDISDKLGEFGRDATGPFQDFANTVGIGKDEAKKLAIEMQNLSSTEVVGELVKRMQEAGASSNEMTQVLESMGNDLSKLLPLFINNSQELNKLTGQFDKINESMALTTDEIESLTDLSASWDLFSGAVGSAAEKISAFIAPAITSGLNATTEALTGTADAIDRITNSVPQLEGLEGKIAQLMPQGDLEQQIAASVEFTDLSKGSPLEQSILAEQRIEKTQEANESLFQLNQEFIEMEAAQWEERNATLLDFDASFNQVLRDNRQSTADFMDKFNKDEQKKEQAKNKWKLSQQQGYIRAAGILANTFFEDNKALNAGLIVADTAVGVQRALTPPVPGAPPNFAAAALIAASGVAQVSNALSSSKGGGSISGGTGAATSTTPQPQQDPQTTVDVSVTEFTDEGTITGRETVSGGSGFENMFSDFLEDQKRNGNLNGSLA